MDQRARFKRAAAVLAGVILTWSPARADFADGMSSAAAEGLGDAGVAMPAEAASLFVNPASLALLDRGDLSLMYAKPLAGVAGVSLQQGVMAVGLPLGERMTFSGGVRAFDNAGLSREIEAAAGGGLRLTDKVSLGGAVSFMRREFHVEDIPGASSDPVFAQGSSKSGLGLDAGFLYEASKDLSLGASTRRINKPDMGLVAEDKVPMTWRAGGAWRRGAFTFLGEIRGRSEATDADSKWGAGVEWRAISPLALRVGADSGKVTAGMGLGMRNLRVDYAFSFTQDLGAGESGSHRVSVGYRFGPARGEEMASRLKKTPVRARPAARKAAPKSSGVRTAPASKSGVSTRDSRAYPVNAPAVKRKAPKRKTWVQ